MPTFDERMAAIMLADAERRMTREGITLADIVNAIDAVYWNHRDITGVPAEPNRLHRASVDCWLTSIRNARALNRPEPRQRSRFNRSRLTVDQQNAVDAQRGTIRADDARFGTNADVD